ncbi:MAG: DNA gyrase subunit A [Candidatus Micrarchaeota archaeon]|nr:DNA gyrase subunit A [Candidatus Micrarchaeota archaeon]
MTIIDKPIEEELKSSYIDYAMSVIVGRALPDVHDGLKPVQRRILFAMYDMGLTSDKNYQKSAKVVGEVLGKYHPHGDSAIYSTLVRLAQDFSLRYTLVDGQGNFGSIDGDDAAAMRYTEVRMQKISNYLLIDLEFNTVDMVPNFDNTLKEPSVLPTRVPNLLINGSTGIAVGMATNIPPHNLNEIIDALIFLIDNQEAKDLDLLKIVKGPDFPTGGIICGSKGIRDAYLTGKGSIVLRGRAKIDEKTNSIIITEIPYTVNKSDLIQEIAELIQNKVIDASSVYDYSNKEGIHIEVKLKKGAIPEVVLNNLYSYTKLQISYQIMNVCILNQMPKLMTLKEMLSEFIKFRERVITRRTKYLLEQTLKRLNIVEGLMIALNDIDNVIKILRYSGSVDEAEQILIKNYNLNQEQVDAILSMKLQLLIKIEHDKLQKEKQELINKKAEYESILNDRNKLLAIMKSEFLEIKQLFGDNRKTEIDESVQVDIVEEDLIEEEDVVIILTSSNYVKRIPLSEYRLQNRGGRGVLTSSQTDNEIVKRVITCSSKDYLLIFTSRGRVFWLKAYKIPELSRYSTGKHISNLIKLEENESPTNLLPISDLTEENYLFIATKRGLVKKVSSIHFSKPRVTGKLAIRLSENDSLADVLVVEDFVNVILSTKLGKAIRFDVNQIRETGRSSKGIRGIRLANGDELISVSKVSVGSQYLLTVTENGFGKRTSIDRYRLQARGGKGITSIITDQRNGNVVFAHTVSDKEQLLLLSSGGKAIRIPVNMIRKVKRIAKGVKLMKLDTDEKIVSCSVVQVEDDNGKHEKENQNSISGSPN